MKRESLSRDDVNDGHWHILAKKALARTPGRDTFKSRGFRIEHGRVPLNIFRVKRAACVASDEWP